MPDELWENGSTVLTLTGKAHRASVDWWHMRELLYVALESLRVGTFKFDLRTTVQTIS